MMAHKSSASEKTGRIRLWLLQALVRVSALLGWMCKKVKINSMLVLVLVLGALVCLVGFYGSVLLALYGWSAKEYETVSGVQKLLTHVAVYAPQYLGVKSAHGLEGYALWHELLGSWRWAYAGAWLLVLLSATLVWAMSVLALMQTNKVLRQSVAQMQLSVREHERKYHAQQQAAHLEQQLPAIQRQCGTKKVRRL